MEALQAATRVRQWAALGMSVDKAKFGLWRLREAGQLDETSKQCLQEGLDLFHLLRQGEEALATGSITEAHQLHAVELYEPFEKERRGVDTGKLPQVIALFEKILNVGVDIRNLPAEEVTDAFRLLVGFSKTYEDAALGELERIERAEGEYETNA
jgi:hypothetical protein